MNNNTLPRYLALIVFILCVLQEVNVFTSIGLIFTTFIFFDFINKLGKVIPIREFIILIASLQWIIGAKISYHFGQSHHKYYMYVDENTYMSYVVPSVLLFYLGLFVFKLSLNKKEIADAFEIDNLEQMKTTYLLIFVGMFSLLLKRYVSIGLDFFLYLSELLIYIGVAYLFFLYPRYKYLIFSSVSLLLFFSSLQSGMFHDFILITTFLSFYVLPRRLSMTVKLVGIIVGFTFIYAIQVVKSDYREIVWHSNANTLEVFWDLVQDNFTSQPQENTYAALKGNELDKKADANNRLNQGWIISKTLENIPSRVPYLNGRSINDALIAGLLPRFFFPDKISSQQGLITFKEVTGLELGKGTAMGLSLVAEFYANYGVVGGLFAMFLYGLCLTLFLKLMLLYFGNNSPYGYLWIILVFFQVVKAETDFLKVFNYLTKSMFLFLLLTFFLNSFGYAPFQKRKIEK